MKGAKSLIAVVVAALIAGAAFADNNTVSMQSIILDDFNGNPYTVYGDTYNYVWKVAGSRFSSKVGDVQYPRVGYIANGPETLKREASDEAERNPPTKKWPNGVQSLGIQAAFDRFGYNWVDIYPTVKGGDGSPAEIPLKGRPYYIDVWTWGSNMNYTMEAYVRDQRGVVHVLPMGSLRYDGWKNLRAEFPANMPVEKRILPRRSDDAKFVKFRVWTNPEARIVVERDPDGTIVPFNLYLAEVKVFSDTYATIFDGDDLADYKKTLDAWKDAPTAPAEGGTAQAGGTGAGQ